MTQAPRIKKAIFMNTTRVPPIYFPTNNWVREIGFDSNKSILPFSSIIGIKLADEKMASNKHRLERGDVIINCIFDITCSSIILLSEGFILDKIEAVSTKLKITASPIKKIIDIAAKNIKTFRAKASLSVYHDMIKILFNYLSCFRLR